MSYVETLVNSELCTRVLFGGLTKTLIEVPTEAAATEVVSKLLYTKHRANYRFNEKHHAWHVTIYH